MAAEGRIHIFNSQIKVQIKDAQHGFNYEYRKNSKKLKYKMEIGLTVSKIMHVIVEALTNEETIEAILILKPPAEYLRHYAIID